MFIHWQCVPLPRNVPTERPNGIKNFELRITKPKRYHLNIFTAIKTFSILSLDRFIYYTKPEEVEQAEATKKNILLKEKRVDVLLNHSSPQSPLFTAANE